VEEFYPHVPSNLPDNTGFPTHQGSPNFCENVCLLSQKCRPVPNKELEKKRKTPLILKNLSVCMTKLGRSTN
jgi:hypothetical protein